MIYKETRESNLYAFLLFLIWPFLSIIVAFYDYRKAWAKNIVWLFVAFYGYTMVISNYGMDANRYRDQFIEASQSNSDTVITPDLYANDIGTVDLLAPLLNSIVSTFTSNYKVLFLIYGLIFGFFFSRNLWILLDRTGHRITIISSLVLFLFFLVNPIWNINGFRFWTAAQIFVYGGLLFILERKKVGLLIATTTLLVHFSFLLPILILFTYSFLGNRLSIYFYFFVFSLFVTELNLEIVRNNLGFLPNIYELRVESYTNEEYVMLLQEKSEILNWYVISKNLALKYSIYVLLLLIYWKGLPFLKRKKALYDLIGFVFLFYGIANIVSLIPSGGRFIAIASALSLALIFLYLQNFDDKRIKLIINILLPAFVLYAVVTIRIGFDTIGITTIFGNPLVALLMDEDIPLINLIK